MYEKYDFLAKVNIIAYFTYKHTIRLLLKSSHNVKTWPT